MSEGAAMFWFLAICVIFTAGEPDLIDGLYEFLSSFNKTTTDSWRRDE